MINAVIVEDESNNAERLKRILERHCAHVSVVAISGTVEDALLAIGSLRPQLVFLDIELPDGTGFDILKENDPPSFHTIFTTAYDHYAIKAIRYGAADYLQKPIDKDELVAAVNRVIKRSSSSAGEQHRFIREAVNNIDQNRVALPTQTGYTIVFIDDIVRCEADANYTRFFLAGGNKIMVSRTLGEYDDLFSDNGFCRVHHSHLINLKHAVKYNKGDGGSVTMSDKSEVEVSKRKKEQFLKMLPRI